jgi:putative endonuclease
MANHASVETSSFKCNKCLHENSGLDTLRTRPPSLDGKSFMAWMYILKCADDSYYVGSTTNLDLRVVQHQSGKGSRYTSGRLPVELVYGEEYDRVSDAYTREKQVQNWSRAKREALINGSLEALPSLAKKKFEKNRNINKPPLVE